MMFTKNAKRKAAAKSGKSANDPQTIRKRRGSRGRCRRRRRGRRHDAEPTVTDGEEVPHAPDRALCAWDGNAGCWRTPGGHEHPRMLTRLTRRADDARSSAAPAGPSWCEERAGATSQREPARGPCRLPPPHTHLWLLHLCDNICACARPPPHRCSCRRRRRPLLLLTEGGEQNPAVLFFKKDQRFFTLSSLSGFDSESLCRFLDHALPYSLLAQGRRRAALARRTTSERESRPEAGPVRRGGARRPARSPTAARRPPARCSPRASAAGRTSSAR